LQVVTTGGGGSSNEKAFVSTVGLAKVPCVNLRTLSEPSVLMENPAKFTRPPTAATPAVPPRAPVPVCREAMTVRVLFVYGISELVLNRHHRLRGKYYSGFAGGDGWVITPSLFAAAKVMVKVAERQRNNY
jgi:hypothetical protein